MIGLIAASDRRGLLLYCDPKACWIGSGKNWAAGLVHFDLIASEIDSLSRSRFLWS